MEKLYLSEQAPWERKMEYYHNIELGKNVQFLTKLDKPLELMPLIPVVLCH